MAKDGVQRWCKPCQWRLYENDLVRVRGFIGDKATRGVVMISPSIEDGYILDRPFNGRRCYFRKELCVVERWTGA